MSIWLPKERFNIVIMTHNRTIPFVNIPFVLSPFPCTSCFNSILTQYFLKSCTFVVVGGGGVFPEVEQNEYCIFYPVY